MQKTYRSVRIKFDELPEATHVSDDTLTDQRYQLLRVGQFSDPRFDEDLMITTEMLRQMVKNFDEKVRGVDIAIDFSHENHKEAAGWVESLELRENDTELWARVQWNDKGLHAITKKEYRYLSSEFMINYRDNETKKSFGTVLLGAGLTNRPVVKRMAPIVELSEISASDGARKYQEGNDQMEEKVKELEAKIAELQAKVDGLLAEKDQALEEKAAAETALSEQKAKVTKLSESNEKLKAEKEKAEKTGEFEKLLSEGKACEAQRDAFMKGDMSDFIAKSKPVNLSEAGSAGGSEEEPSEGGSVEDRVQALAEKKEKENEGMSYAEAVSAVLHEDEALAKEYEKAVAL